jgi:hypothetical protein
LHMLQQSCVGAARAHLAQAVFERLERFLHLGFGLFFLLWDIHFLFTIIRV